MQKRLVADLLDRAFGGSAGKLVAALAVPTVVGCLKPVIPQST